MKQDKDFSQQQTEMEMFHKGPMLHYEIKNEEEKSNFLIMNWSIFLRLCY